MGDDLEDWYTLRNSLSVRMQLVIHYAYFKYAFACTSDILTQCLRIFLYNQANVHLRIMRRFMHTKNNIIRIKICLRRPSTIIIPVERGLTEF